MADGFVRVALPDDADAIARLQVETWRAAYAGILPAAALAEATGDAAQRRWGEAWTAAISEPPSKRHAVLVAVEGTGSREDSGISGGNEPDEPVGVAALEPATDADALPATDAELLTLLVAPAYGRRGHGSRLLAASADHLRAHGFVAALTWVFADDGVSRAFLESAGWGFDNAHRDLDMGEPVRQLRMHTALT